MKDPMFLTLIFIVISALIAAIARKFQKDKCLKDFQGYLVTLELKTGKSAVFGVLRVYKDCLEFLYLKSYKDKEGHNGYSYVLYSPEYDAKLGLLLRYHNHLSPENQKKRVLTLEKVYHPKFFRRFQRKILILFRTVKDSVLEVVNLFISQAQSRGPTKNVFSSSR